MELRQVQTQNQTLSPQAIQTLALLQMNRQELTDYLQELSMENPVVEVELPQPEQPLQPERAPNQWLEETDRQNQWFIRQDHREDKVPACDTAAAQETEDALGVYVRSQLNVRQPELERAVYIITESLDENGWLSDSLEALSAVSALSYRTLLGALKLVQGAEPAGVGARDLRECLLLQMERQQDCDPVAKAIVSDHLTDLAKNHFNAIAQALGVTQDAVRRAVRVILDLNPRPGSGFSACEDAGYVTPDVTAQRTEQGLRFRLNDAFQPQMHINDYYARMAKQSGEPEVIAYLEGKLRQAEWVSEALEQRKDTLLRCMSAIADRQQEFFQTGDGEIRPMTQRDVAQAVGVHESTVSRAVRGKYLSFANRTVPLSLFFARAASTAEAQLSAQEAKRRIRRLILGEDGAKPYSDQKICDLLGEEGCNLSRRTVTKYREEMGFGPACGRKK